jgi:hypothetical protein
MTTSKYERAKRAIQDLFGDTSVSAEVTRDLLDDLRNEIDLLMDAIDIGPKE